MELYEAIAHAREVAQRREDMCDECRAEHSQLADWLQELAAYRATGMKPGDILSPLEMADMACAVLELRKYKDTGLSPQEVQVMAKVMKCEDRLTYKSANDEHWYLKDGVSVRGYDKLAAYENIGLTPAQVAALVSLKSAKPGEPMPTCFEAGVDGNCMGFQTSPEDDEPCELCKNCWYCSAGYYAEEKDHERDAEQ